MKITQSQTRPHHRRASIVFASLLAATVIPLAKGAPGDLDPSFTGGGKFTFGFGGAGDLARAVKVQPDGKLVVVGRTSAGSKVVLGIARYHADGSRDTSFGGDGAVVTDLPESSPGDQFLQDDAHAVEIQSDGKILVAGSSDQQTGNSDFSIVRYHPDGSLDTSFGGTGFVMVNFGGMDFAYDVRLQADGKIVVGGYSNALFAVTRLNPDGSYDTTLNGTGKVTTVVAPGGNRSVRTGMALQSDNKIVMAGSVSGFSGFIVVRYNTNGSLDTSFDLDGKVISPVLSSAQATAVAIQPATNVIEADKIVVAGYAFDGSKEVFAAVRYNIAGELDTSFDGDGKVTTAIPGGTQTRSFSVAIEGTTPKQPRKIVLAGLASTTSNGQTVSRFATVRYNVDGSLDSGFDGEGIALGSLSDRDAGAGVVLSAGKIIVVGESVTPGRARTDFAILRYNSDGTLDNTLDLDGRKVDDLGAKTAACRAIVVQPDGKIVLAGVSDDLPPHLALARLNPDGTFDNSFGTGGKVVDARHWLEGNAVALQPDGKIVVAGLYDTAGLTLSHDFAVLRYNPDGSPDNSFDGDGIAQVQVTTDHDEALAVALQPDGKIVVAGWGAGSNHDIALVRLNPDGSLDNTFDFDGKVVVGVSPAEDIAYSVAVQPDGKIILAGSAGQAPRRFFLARFNPNGAPDNSFGENGVVFTSIGNGDAVIRALLLLPSGHIAVTGHASNGTNFDFVVARYRSNGSLDPAFNGGAPVLTPIGSSDDVGRAMVVQPDGKLLVAGGTTPHLFHGNVLANTPVIKGDYALVRYNYDGSLDPSYGNGGKALVQFGSGRFDQGLALALDSSGNAVVAGEVAELFGIARVQTGPLVPTTLANISTRLRVATGDNVLIGGFIVTGTQPKRVIVRAIGPSLPLAGKLANPTLELHGPSGLIESNDNWVDSPNRQAIVDTTVPPGNDAESAIVATLPAGNAGYTAVVRGVNNGTGIGVVEAYDLDRTVDSQLANISTRGLVQTGDNVLIAGTIVLGPSSRGVIVRALGPSLPVSGRMSDPTLELRNANGGLVRANDNWRTGGQESDIIATSIPPVNDSESAIVETLAGNGASYTAIVRGANNTTGIAVVEVYALN